jgi:hypothetical protein
VIDARAKSTVRKYAGGYKSFAKWTEKYSKCQKKQAHFS